MKITQGFSYHIKDEFFENVNDKNLMTNKENGGYRPHYCAIKDLSQDGLIWMIPISSKVQKYKDVMKDKMKKYGRCNTIVINKFGGKGAAFLLQNAFLIKEEYVSHIHTIKNIPVAIHKKVEKEIISNLRELIALKRKGVDLFLVNVDEIVEKINK